MSHTDNSSTSPPTVVITGASTGIGQACAVELDRRGFRVFAGVRSEAAAADLKSQTFARLAPLMLDVTDAALIATAAETVTNAVGQAGLAGLVNNAGIAVAGPLEALPIDALRKQLEVNVIGQVAVTQAFLPLLRTAHGRVINMSSINGGLAVPYMGAYAASKFALEAITDALRLELRTFGIRVSAIEPAAIATPIWQKSIETADRIEANASPEILALYETDLAAVRKAVDQSARTAAPVDRVVRAVVHALTSKRPKTRYFLGPQVRFSFKGMRLMNDHVRDWIVRKLIGLP